MGKSGGFRYGREKILIFQKKRTIREVYGKNVT